MILKWLGQSGYLLKSQNSELLLDPYLSDIVYRKQGLKRLVPSPLRPQEIAADAIVCSHNHLDHLDLDAIPLMPKNILFITTNEGKQQLLSMGRENVRALNVGEEIIVGDFTVKAVYARHSCEAFGVLITCEDKRYYFSGDTLFDEKLFEIAKEKPDVAFLCINGKLGNMTVDEAVMLANTLQASINIPNHYGMFLSNTENPEKFINRVKKGQILQFNRKYIF